MSSKYVCTTCGGIFTPSTFDRGKPVCPNGRSHTVYTLEEACDIINAYIREIREQKELDWELDD